MHTMPHEKWIAHSPYSDGTFRGLEKSTGVLFRADGMRPTLDAREAGSCVAIVILDSREEIEAYIAAHGLADYGYVSVCVHVVTPAARSPLNTLERTDADL